jgi:ABC-type transport system involved in cytochrome bd biosynthesis fused ATPase/permease subunit
VALVTHDMAAASHADQVIVLRDGQIQRQHGFQRLADRREALVRMLGIEG